MEELWDLEFAQKQSGRPKKTNIESLLILKQVAKNLCYSRKSGENMCYSRKIGEKIVL